MACVASKSSLSLHSKFSGFSVPAAYSACRVCPNSVPIFFASVSRWIGLSGLICCIGFSCLLWLSGWVFYSFKSLSATALAPLLVDFSSVISYRSSSVGSSKLMLSKLRNLVYSFSSTVSSAFILIRLVRVSLHVHLELL